MSTIIGKFFLIEKRKLKKTFLGKKATIREHGTP